MKCVILAGGYGTRFSEETYNKPKPMIEIGGMPILWHIMKIYEKHNVTDFIICLGYKGYLIKEFFTNYIRHMSNITINFKSNSLDYHKIDVEPWKITLVDTGSSSMTGGRLLKVKQYLSKSESFCFTYGDGLSDIDISDEIKFHNNHGKLSTVCAVQPPNRYGVLDIKGTTVKSFQEKPSDSNWINGGFFILKYDAIDLIDDEQTIWEKKPLKTLAEKGELQAYHHNKFWHPMDTLRDHNYLEDLWHNNKSPWKTW
tara:strand:- start:3774 stop:4541 length:768 start_codon:yes stop_codon:yes gene_type:complete